MDLVIFDIDGTLVDSVQTDDQCFIEAFQCLHNIDLSQTDWDDFEHVTDLGLTNEIFETRFSRTPTGAEILEFKTHFYALLKKRINGIVEVKGASKVLDSLISNPAFSIAFATGGWKETALLKLSAIGFELGEITLVSSNEHFDRAEIIRLAIEDVLSKTGLNEFDSITYVGDGLWDFNTAKKLGINFIGIDIKRNNILLNAGANPVANDLENLAQLLAWVTKEK